MREVQGRRRPRARARRERLAAAGRDRAHARAGIAATRWRTTSPARRSSRRRRCTARSTWPRTPASGSRSCTSRAPSAPSLVRDEKRRGRPVTMEICPHHLLLDLDDLVRLGPYGVCAPALRERALVERLWDSVLDGTADCLVSDHAASTRAEKDAGYDDIFLSPLGCQVMQETVPLVLDEAFHRRGLPLEAFVRFSSTNAARISGTVSAQGHAAPGRRCRRRPLRPRERVAGRRAQPAVLQEPVVAVRRSPRACPRRAHARAGRDGLRRRRDPGRAGLGPLPLVPRRLRAHAGRRVTTDHQDCQCSTLSSGFRLAGLKSVPRV